MSTAAHDDKAVATKAETDLACYTAAVTAVAAGVKTLCEAGMGGPAAGALAADLYCKVNGIKTE